MRRRRPLIAALMILAMAGPARAAGQFGLFNRGSKATDGQTFRSPDGKFSLEYPSKDWQILPGGGSVVATLAPKSGDASVVIDYTKMSQALAPNEINDLFAELEGEDLATRQPEAKSAKPSIVNVGSRRVVVIQYSRAGLKGQEKVVQYTVPVGQDVYRLICSAQETAFPKYEPVFMRMIETFQAPPPGARPPAK
jgi:hypothetical protein